MLRIGLSACFLYPDPQRNVFAPKTLQYLEQSIAHWVMAAGAMPVMIPQPAAGSAIGLRDYAIDLDGLILQGGSDVCPASYGEETMKPQWNGDRNRDRYEIALLREFMALGKPVLGVCRGAQLINVAFGGTLFQDIPTQCPSARQHRDAALYDQIFHTIAIVPGSGLAQLYPGREQARVNSVHHQAPKDLGRDLVIEARCSEDEIIEALRWRGDSYVFGVQWHPEFQDPARTDLLDTAPLRQDFLAHARARRSEKRGHA